MEQVTSVTVQPADKKKIIGIWKVALYLAVITAVEYVFAFTMEAGTLRTVIFISLTILKAFYIVSEFMHLGHEVKGLVYSILLPMIFVLWFIVSLVNIEGAAVKGSRGTTDFVPSETEQVEDPGH